MPCQTSSAASLKWEQTRLWLQRGLPSVMEPANGWLHAYQLLPSCLCDSRQLHWQFQHESRKHTWPMAANTADEACAAASLAPEAVTF